VRASLLPTLGLIGWIAAAPSLPSMSSLPELFRPHLPAWAEKLLFNPRERTEETRARYGKGDGKGAARAADTALRLAPDQPLTQFNQGTAHLAAGDEKGAISTLEGTVKKAPPELAPAAYYNLGNARLKAGDASGAVAAYRETLLREPGNRDAKYNLELALRKEKDQKAPAPGQRPGQLGQNKKEQGPGAGGQQGEAGPQNQGAPKPGDGPPSQQGAPPNPGQTPPPQGSGDSRLRGFRDQPDMSAKEAAALLNAVENLERQQRREQAAKRARERASRDKDW
jgi:Ca-activated chloride channel family protein